jgi:pyridoxal phosphate enzyme (YggS family)
VQADVLAEADLAERIQRVRATIADAAMRSGRRPEDVTLVAVSKTVGAERVLAAARLGITDFGENRVQEAEAKISALSGKLPPAVRWHLVGHLQTNKARTAVRLFSLIESVDSFGLADVLNREGARRGAPVPVLLEVNVGGEPTKFGFAPDAMSNIFPRVLELPMLDVRGLMTVAPIVEDPEDARPYFRELRDLRDRLARENPRAALPELSMGMTGDYPVAIEEGATIVRVGRAIFGERPA